MLTVFSVTDNFYISNNKLNWLSTSQDIKKIFNLLAFQISHKEIPLTAHELKKNNITEFFQIIVHFSINQSICPYNNTVQYILLSWIICILNLMVKDPKSCLVQGHPDNEARILALKPSDS